MACSTTSLVSDSASSDECSHCGTTHNKKYNQTWHTSSAKGIPIQLFTCLIKNTLGMISVSVNKKIINSGVACHYTPL